MTASPPGVVIVPAPPSCGVSGPLALAAAGRVDPALLEELLADPRLGEEPPRSLGREEFGTPFVERLVARARPRDAAAWCDLLATAAAFTVEAVARAIERRVPLAYRPGRLVAAGGGVRNPLVVASLAARVAPLPLLASDALGLPAALKEPIAFALLAAARIEGIPAGLPSVTGAARAVLLGKITES